jgi:cytochrome c biogenesis protein
VNALLASGGWKARAQVREHGTMVAARKGTSNKIGYLAAHSAIVLICLGGLLDGDLIVRAQMACRARRPTAAAAWSATCRPQHRLSAANPTFRGQPLRARRRHAPAWRC